MRNRTRVLTFVASIVCIALLGFFVATLRMPTLHAYHRWKFDAAKDYILNGPREYHSDGAVSIDVTDVMPAFDHHLARLAELNAIARVEYTFSNITNDSPLRSEMVKRMLADGCPTNLNWESVAPGDTSPTTIVAWCEHDDADAWERFVRMEDQAAAQRP